MCAGGKNEMESRTLTSPSYSKGREKTTIKLSKSRYL
jgi:hypothetical protein